MTLTYEQGPVSNDPLKTGEHLALQGLVAGAWQKNGRDTKKWRAPMKDSSGVAELEYKAVNPRPGGSGPQGSKTLYVSVY